MILIIKGVLHHVSPAELLCIEIGWHNWHVITANSFILESNNVCRISWLKLPYPSVFISENALIFYPGIKVENVTASAFENVSFTIHCLVLLHLHEKFVLRKCI